MTQPLPQAMAPPPTGAPPPTVAPPPPPNEAASPPPPSPTAPEKVGLDALKEMAPDAMTDAFRAGQLGFHAQEMVPVRLSDGGLGRVPASSLQVAIDQGAQIVHPDVVQRAELEAKYGDAMGTAGAAVAGAARGLTVGLSDPLALGIAGAVGGDEAKEHLRERLNAYKEIHPYASTAGEVAGIVAPALLSGGAAAVPEGAGLGLRAARLVGEGLSAPLNAVSAAGHVAEAAGARVAANIGGTVTERLAVRAAQKAITKAAGGAVEGAIFGAGSGISEASLGDPKATGEKVWATIGHDAILGALTGGAGGAALGAGGEAFGDALASVRAKASPYLRAKAEEAAVRSVNANKTLQRAIEALPGGERAAGRFMLDRVGIVAGDTVETIAPKTEKVREQIGEAIGKTIQDADAAGIEGPKVEELARQVSAGTVPRLKVMGISNSGAIRDVEDVIADLRRFGGVEDVPEVKAPKMPGESERPAVGRPPPEFKPPKPPPLPPEPTAEEIGALKDNLEARGYTKNTALRARNQAYAEWRATVAKQASEHEEAVAAARAEHDASVAEYKKDRTTAMEWRSGEFARRLSEHEGSVAEAIAARNEALESNENARFTFSKLHQFRAYLDDQIRWNRAPGVPDSPKVEAFKAARGIIEDAIVGEGERAAKERGSEFVSTYKSLKRDYQYARALDNAAQDAATRMGANARHSLTDKLFAGHGMHAGALGAMMMGHPVTAIAHGVVMGAATGAASKLVRERGNSALAVWYDKLATLQAIARRTNQADAEVNKAAADFVKRAVGSADDIAAAATSSKPKVRIRTVSKASTKEQDPHEQYATRVAQIEAAQKLAGYDPVAADLAQHAPQTSAAVADRAQTATAYLASQVPKPNKYGSGTPSDQDVFEFNEKYEAATRPLPTLRQGLATGTLTRTQVDAARAVVPSVVDQLQRTIESQLAIAIAKDKTIPYDVKRDLALLFDLDDDWALSDDGVKTLQKNAHTPLNANDNGQPAQGPKRGSVTTPSSTLMQTDTERRQGGQIR